MNRLLSIAPSPARWTCGTVVPSLYDTINPATREKLLFSTPQHVHSSTPYSSHLRCLSSTHLNHLSRQRYCTLSAPYRDSKLIPSISHPLYFSSQQEQVLTSSSNRPSCSRLLISIVAKPYSRPLHHVCLASFSRTLYNHINHTSVAQLDERDKFPA
jgi:hypothetical protein